MNTNWMRGKGLFVALIFSLNGTISLSSTPTPAPGTLPVCGSGQVTCMDCPDGGGLCSGQNSSYGTYGQQVNQTWCTPQFDQGCADAGCTFQSSITTSTDPCTETSYANEA